MNLHYIPAFDSEFELNDQLNRAVWYFNCLLNTTTYFYSSVDHSYENFPYFSSKLPALYKDLSANGRISICNDVDLVEAIPSKGDYIVQWCRTEGLSKSDKALLNTWKAKGIKVFDINRTRRMEGSLYIEVSRAFYQADVNFVEVNQRKFENLFAKHRHTEKAFLFCTGPSIEEYVNYNYDGGLTIICNSVINDEEFMQLVDPDILVFADPIFHFGCSSYAEAFRDRLRDVAARFDFDIVIPVKYYQLFCHSMPELAERTIAIPYADHNKEFGLDLSSRFLVKSTDNILTFLMLPLATSLANDIYIMGCDGRPLEEDDYFWSHNKKMQFSNEMDSIKRAHPSFFKLEYNEYYLRHCKTLKQIFEQGEAIGKTFVSLSFSHIPVLKDREFVYRKLAKNHDKSLLVSVNPDAKDGFGHYYHYDERLCEALQEGEELLIVGNRAAELNGLPCEISKTFLDNTWAVRWNPDVEVFQQWCEALCAVLENLVVLRRPKIVYMYMGSIRFYAAFLEVLWRLRFPVDVIFKLNLFYAHMDYALDGFKESAKYEEYGRLFDYYSKGPINNTIEIYSDSERLRSHLEEDFDVRLALWPMIGVTNPDLIERSKQNMQIREVRSKTLTVLFPGNGQIAKGYDLVCDLLSSYDSAPQINGCSVSFLIRDQLRDSEPNNSVLSEKLSKLRNLSWVDIIKGHLTEQEYIDLFIRADVVMLPYRKSSFYSRTSGCVIDALSFSKPIVTFKGTWLGDCVEFLNVGVSVNEGDVEAMKSGLETVFEQKFAYPLDVQAKFGAKNLRSLLIAGSEFSQASFYNRDIVAENVRRFLREELGLNTQHLLNNSERIHEGKKLSKAPVVENMKKSDGQQHLFKRIARRLESNPRVYDFVRRCWHFIRLPRANR